MRFYAILCAGEVRGVAKRVRLNQKPEPVPRLAFANKNAKGIESKACPITLSGYCHAPDDTGLEIAGHASRKKEEYCETFRKDEQIGRLCLAALVVILTVSGAFERRYVDGLFGGGDWLDADSARAAVGLLVDQSSEMASLPPAATPFADGRCLYAEAAIAGRRGAGIDGPGQGSAVKPGPAVVDAEPLLQEARAPDPVSEGFAVTTYGESYNGSPLGCGGVYSSGDSSILAVGPANSSRWPCGAHVTVCGPTGACLDMVRVDSCPGCGATRLDTSESAYAALCGSDASGPCAVEVRG